jgi:DNA polymerase
MNLIEIVESCSSVDAHALIEAIVGDTLPWVSKSIRATLIAKQGCRLLGGDFSNVEGRVGTWLAGETWKLKAFEDYDNGTGKDLYNLSYARSFNASPDNLTQKQRQIGKVQELALGFQGSVYAYIGMAANYGLKPRELVAPVHEVTTTAQWNEVAQRYEPGQRLQRDEWTALKIIVNNWRKEHPMVCQSWWDVQDAAVEAVSSPGRIVPVLAGRVNYLVSRNFLWCQLPSGRVLAYNNPRLRVMEGANGRKRTVVDYDGWDNMFKAWTTFTLYGGFQIENIVQATARDLLLNSIHMCERGGYPIILHVHDEVVTELPLGVGSPEELSLLMSIRPPWPTDGLPLAVKTWEDRRYVK